MAENRWGVPPEEAQILEELEQMSTRGSFSLPLVETIEYNKRGVIVEKGKVTGLSLFQMYPEKSSALSTLIGELQSLKILNLRTNSLKSLPETLGGLKSLHTLWLAENMLCEFPALLPWFKSLRKLDLGRNAIKILPESPEIFTDGFQLLESLDLSYNGLVSLPESFGNLKSLQELYLTQNGLTALPESFGHLNSLRELHLIMNELVKLPESFGQLKSLQNLYLHYNQLTTLPESFGQLESLRILSISNNQLTRLPVSIGQLHNLQEFSISINEITTLPESLGNLRSLQKLEIYDNQLVVLPATFGKLKALQTLDLRGNKLITLPKSFWQLQNLTALKINDNCWEKGLRSLIKENSAEIVYRGEHLTDGSITNIAEFLDQLRAIATINLFISHVEREYNIYQIEALADYLGQQEEIYPEVFYSEKYMVGDMEESMVKNIEESQIILFIATQASLASGPCQFELETARKLDKEILPLKGTDVTWDELAVKGLAYVKGLDIDLENFEQFCADLYDYIKKYKREINLFEKEQATLDKKILKLKEDFQTLVDSPEFRKQPEKIEVLSNCLKKFKE